MTTLADIDCLRSIVGGMRKGRVALEFGPWLGAFSVEMAKTLELHVVDNFEWTKDHNRKVPDKITPGQSFRPLFEATMADHGLAATVHEGPFEGFVWDGPNIDLVVIDGPKNAAKLKPCLASILPHLAPDGLILLKHGLGPLYVDMVAYLAHLVDAGILVVPAQSVDKSCTILQLRAGPNVDRFDNVQPDDPDWGMDATFAAPLDLAPEHPFRFFMVINAAIAQDWACALDHLSSMPSNPALVRAWDKIEAALLKAKTDPTGLATLSEIVAIHHARALKQPLPVAFHASAAIAQRGFWLNNAGNDWRGRAYQPDIIARAFDFGYMGWPSKVRDVVTGKDILDIGCGPGLHGIGYLAAGAKSYLGLDPILKPDRDRVKNLSARTKEAFGWTPNQMSELIEPWHASPEAVGDTPLERRFDLATLHNVTEHLHMLDEIFADIALRLREGGKILYNHHNFYSWNGHHLPPKTVSQIDQTDPAQREMIDWGHVEYDPAPEHYIARGLNRVRLDEIIAITQKYFDIEDMEEIPSRPETGANRLTDAIRQRYDYLEDRDLLTQNLYCVAKVRI